MQKIIAVAFLVVATSCLNTEAKVFTRCGLVQELRRQGFPENKLRDWVCLVESESSRNTAKVGPTNKNGSKDHGLYQINDKFWCSNNNTPGKDCHVTCAQVTTDDITAASTCAKKIFKRHGFNAWYGWRSKCQGALPDISSC